MRHVALIAVTALVVVVGSNAAVAAPIEGQDHDSRILSNKLYVNLGAYLVDYQADAAVGSGTVIGTSVNLEDDLGLDGNDSELRFEGFWRFKRKHLLGFSYVGLRRSGFTFIDESITIGDPPQTFDVGADIASKIDSDVFTLNYRYSFFNNGKVDTGFAAGLSVFAFDLALAGTVTVDDGMGGTTTEAGSVSESIPAPIPTMGFFTNFAITPNLIFRMEAGFLDIQVDDYDGRMVDTQLVFDWFFTKNVGIGGGFATTDLRFAKKGTNPFIVDYRFGGVLFYFSGVWGK